MNKNEQTSTNNKRVIKWYKALILAFAATLSFHYHLKIEAMNNASGSNTTQSEQRNHLTDNDQYEIEYQLKKYTLALASSLGLETKKNVPAKTVVVNDDFDYEYKYEEQEDMDQQELQAAINKKLKLKEHYESQDYDTDRRILNSINQSLQALNDLLKQAKNDQTYHSKIMQLKQSYLQLLARILSANKELSYNYLMNKDKTINLHNRKKVCLMAL